MIQYLFMGNEQTHPLHLIDKNIIVGHLKLIGISLQTLENIIGCQMDLLA